MPGKNRPTKIIRRKAYNDVYANNGAMLTENMIPSYDKPEHKELYVKVYTQVYNSFHFYESIIKDMSEFYGHWN